MGVQKTDMCYHKQNNVKKLNRKKEGNFKTESVILWAFYFK